jgi:hypothetical protein
MQARRFVHLVVAALLTLALGCGANDEEHPAAMAVTGAPGTGSGESATSTPSGAPPNVGGANNGPLPASNGSTLVGTGQGTGGGIPAAAGLGATGIGFGNNPATGTGGEPVPITGSGTTGIPITGGGIPGAAGLGATGIGTPIASPVDAGVITPTVVVVN